MAEKWTKSALWRPPKTSWLPLLHLRFTFLFPSLCGAPCGRAGEEACSASEVRTRHDSPVSSVAAVASAHPTQVRESPLLPPKPPAPPTLGRKPSPLSPKRWSVSPPPPIRSWGSVPQWLLLCTDSQFPRQGFDRRANSLSQPSSLHQLTVAFWTPTALPQQEALFPWRSTPSFPPPHPLAPS